MVFLGFWQLDRRDQKREFNATVVSRTDIAPAPIGDVVGSQANPDDLEWRIVTATGRFLADEAVTIINRSQDGTAGYSPLAPLLLGDGQVVFVNRGFVPLNVASPQTPNDTVSVLGYLRKTQKRGSLGAVDSTDATTTEFHRIDLSLISRRVEQPTLPMYIQLIEQSPAQTETWPAPAKLPELDEGPHFSYAVQWWFFSLVALTAWGVVARRAVRKSTSAMDVQEQTSV